LSVPVNRITRKS